MKVKYLEIYQDLISCLQNGVYEVGGLLPSDAKLVQRYAVARETVRRAIQRLVREGYVQRVKGKGTVVLGLKKVHYPIKDLESYQEIMARYDVDTETELLKQFDWAQIPDEMLDERMVVPNIEFMHIARRRKINQKPVVVDHDYINPLVVPMVTEEIAKQSLFAYFEDELHLKIAYAVRSMVIEIVDNKDCQLLGAKPETPIVVIRNATYLDDGRLLALTESRHRADAFKNVEIARREKGVS